MWSLIKCSNIAFSTLHLKHSNFCGLSGSMTNREVLSIFLFTFLVLGEIWCFRLGIFCVIIIFSTISEIGDVYWMTKKSERKCFLHKINIYFELIASVTSISHLAMSNSIWHRIAQSVNEVNVDKGPLLVQSLRQLIQSRWSMRIIRAHSPAQFVPRMLNGWQIRWSRWPRQGGDPRVSDCRSYRDRAMRCGVIVLEDQMFLLNDTIGMTIGSTMSFL